mgnify:CR=1 FL=1
MECHRNSADTNVINTENPQIIFVRLENIEFPDCYTITSFQIVVKEQPFLLMECYSFICKDDTLEIIVDSRYEDYSWSTGETIK